MSFHNLPNEVIRLIISFTHPSALNTLSCISAQLHELVAPFLALYKQCQHVKLGWESYGSQSNFYKDDFEDMVIAAASPPAVFLRNLLVHPERAWFVRKVGLLLAYDDWGSAQADDCEVEIVRKIIQEEDGFGELLRACPYFEDEDMTEAARQSILAGNVPTVFALILTLLPNLHTVYICDDRHDDDHPSPITPLVTTIAKATIRDAAVAPHRQHALSQLTTFELRHSDNRYGEDYHVCIPFALLPSLRHLRGNNIVGDLVENTSVCAHSDAGELCPPTAPLFDGAPAPAHCTTAWPYATGASRVESITWTESGISPVALRSLLRAFPNLQRFSYTSGGALVSYEEFELPEIVGGLLEYAAHSLTHLTLQRDETGLADLGPSAGTLLRKFEVLRHVSLDAELLARDDFIPDLQNHTVYALIDAMPASLETLRLDETTAGCDQIDHLTTRLFEGFVAEREEKLPNLKEVQITSLEEDVIRLVEREARAAGVNSQSWLDRPGMSTWCQKEQGTGTGRWVTFTDVVVPHRPTLHRINGVVVED